MKRCHSLGPANDADPNVAIEIRAAEIAASGFQGPGWRLRSMHWWEGCGWDDGAEHELCGPLGESADGPNHLAGYLAAAIVHHDTDQTFANAAAVIAEVRAPFAPGVKLK